MTVSVELPLSTTILGQMRIAAGLSDVVKARADDAPPSTQATSASPAKVPTDATRVIFIITHLLSLPLPANGEFPEKRFSFMAVPRPPPSPYGPVDVEGRTMMSPGRLPTLCRLKASLPVPEPFV